MRIDKRAWGFTLIEIIMALAILAVGIIGVVRLLPVGLKASRSAEMMSKAAFLAQKKLEELKLAGFTRLMPEPTVPLEGEEGLFRWEAQVSPVSLEGVHSSEEICQVVLAVSWEEKGRSRSQEFVTYIGK